MRLAARFIPLLCLSLPLSRLHAACVVTHLQVADHSRSSGVPFSSAADSGAPSARVHALVYAPGTARVRPTYAQLLALVTPGGDPAEHLISRLRFHGATIDSSAVMRAVRERSTCGTSDALTPPPRAIVFIAGTLPPVMYEGGAAALAEQGIATVVTVGGESALRLLINHFATLRWPVQRIALVGHGANGPPVQLIAMSSAAVRAIVSLDGFEALDRRRVPGLTGDAAWRPGNLRAPILHWRARGHPAEDTTHVAQAMRSDVFQVTIGELQGREFLAAPEVALAPVALQSLVGEAGGRVHAVVTRATVQFLADRLGGRSVNADDLRRTLPESFVVTHRPALPAPAILLDGRLDERVWASARTLPDATSMRVRVTDDCDWLYAAVVAGRNSPFITEVVLRSPSTVGPTLQPADLLLHASASLCWAWGKDEVTSADCNRSEAWWGASRTSQAGDAPVGEYAIAKRALGIARCGSIDGVGIGALTGGWGVREVFPAAMVKAEPGTWATIR